MFIVCIVMGDRGGNEMNNTIQDRAPNFRDKDGNLYLIRCFECDSVYGNENWIPAAASGQCAHCGWKETMQPQN